jgi:hypothetical protein
MIIASKRAAYNTNRDISTTFFITIFELDTSSFSIVWINAKWFWNTLLIESREIEKGRSVKNYISHMTGLQAFTR